MSTRGQGHSLTFAQDSHSMTISNISSEATWPVVTKFNEEASGAEGTKLLSRSSNKTNMVAMRVDRKNL